MVAVCYLPACYFARDAFLAHLPVTPFISSSYTYPTALGTSLARDLLCLLTQTDLSDSLKCKNQKLNIKIIDTALRPKHFY